MKNITRIRLRLCLTIIFVSLLAIGLVSALLHLNSSPPVVVEISQIVVTGSGDQVAKVSFHSRSKKSYVGTFRTEVFVGEQWVESASQHADARKARTVSQEPGEVFDIPVPDESPKWRVRWRGNRDYAQVGPLLKKLEEILSRPFFYETLHIRFDPVPGVDVSTVIDQQNDF